MRAGNLIGIGSALTWFAFPMVPALLGSTYDRTCNLDVAGNGPPDPRVWDQWRWVILTGPLVGYGFLAGATLDLPDDPPLRGARNWISRRSTWVAIGPWIGFLAWSAIYFAIVSINWAYPPSQTWSMPALPPGWQSTRAFWLLIWVLWVLAVGSLAFGWLLVAWVVFLRAKRLGRLGGSIVRGLAVAVGFVGSLFGSFWAITEAWRGYFFDPRIVPALLAAASLGLMSGCAAPVTYGEVRRRELFHAMLMAWLLGLALAWRWWSRSRPKPPNSPRAEA